MKFTLLVAVGVVSGEKFTQTTCFNEECTLSCRSHEFPLNQCLRAQGDLSAIIACKEDTVEQQTFCGSSCAGDVAETKEIPQNVCVKGSQPADYFKDSCSSEQNGTALSSTRVAEVSEESFAQMIFNHRKPRANGTWSQKVCSGSGCTEDDKCEIETYNQGQCYPVEGGGSAIGECWTCGVQLSLWAADGCPGAPSQIRNEPVGECAKQQGGSWAMNFCDSSRSSLVVGSPRKVRLSIGATFGTISSTHLSSAQGNHHYEAPPCQDDEVAARLSGGGGALCAAQCGEDGSCSQDFPEDVKNPQPSCILQDQAGNKYCALTCGFRSGGDCPSGASCTSGVCAYNSYNSTNVVTTTLEKQGADFSQLVCKDRKCSAECETESYTFSDCLPVVGGGSARGVSCCDDASCVVQGSDFGLLLDVYRSDDCTGSSQRMKQPVTQCLHTSSGDKKFAKFVCGGNSSLAASLLSELNLQSPTFEYV